MKRKNNELDDVNETDNYGDLLPKSSNQNKHYPYNVNKNKNCHFVGKLFTFTGHQL